jgi:Flp pilus assembly protein TadB
VGEWAEVVRVAGTGAFGALVFALGRLLYLWRSERRADRAQDVDADERERAMALAERQRAVDEVWAIVEDLRRTKDNHETRIRTLEGELSGERRDNDRLRRLVIVLGGDPWGDPNGR